MIKIKNLNKYYHKGKANEIHVINNTTITLADTGLICILGESGSGKTTLMNTISGLDDFADGEIEVDDILVHKFGDKNQEYIRNEKFGYIFQNYYLLQDRTVEYNIMLALSLYDIPDEDKKERIDYVLRAVDMWKYKKRLVSQLSGGQQQRIAIARALAKSPKVIFADEPTGNLDEANTMKIMGILKKISENCLVVVVTHEKSIADFFADRILWIADGTIQKEIDRTEKGSYEYVEDTNLYLKEFEKTEVQEQGISLQVYGNEEVPEIKLQVICENGKIYLHAESDEEFVFLSSADEKKMIDAHKPVANQEDLEQIDFTLEHIEGAKKPKMTAREIMDIAKTNIAVLGKKQIFLVFTLFAVAVLIVLTVQDLLGIMHIEKKSLVTTDSRYYLVTAEKDTMITDAEYKEYFSDMTESFQKNGFDTYIVPVTKLTYQYSGYQQLEYADYNLKNYFLASVEKLDEKDLIYGKMPESDEEIVVDRWVLENFMAQSSQVENVMKQVKQALGSTITTDSGLMLTIVGICETEEPDIYMDENVILMLSRGNLNFLTDTKAEKLFEGFEAGDVGVSEDGTIRLLVDEKTLLTTFNKDMDARYGSMVEAYESLERAKNRNDSRGKTLEEYEEEYQKRVEVCGKTYEEYMEMMMKDTYKDYMYTGTLTGGVKYQVVGYFPTSYGVDYIISEDACDGIAKAIMDTYKQCYLYVDQADCAEEAEKLIRAAIPETVAQSLNIKIQNGYETVLEKHETERNQKIGARILMMATIFLISLIILYFMMKANAIARMQDLGVYRMLGISKYSIIGMFAYENFIITTYTSMAGVALTIFVSYVIAQIPSMEMEFYFPWYILVAVVCVIYIVNILIGIWPIRKMLKLPPAQLASKYDI